MVSSLLPEIESSNQSIFTLVIQFLKETIDSTVKSITGIMRKWKYFYYARDGPNNRYFHPHPRDHPVGL